MYRVVHSNEHDIRPIKFLEFWSLGFLKNIVDKWTVEKETAVVMPAIPN